MRIENRAMPWLWSKNGMDGWMDGWMDGGAVEQEERARIQNLVKLNRKRTRTSKKTTPREGKISALDQNSDVERSSSNFSLPETILESFLDIDTDGFHGLPETLFSPENGPKIVEEVNEDYTVGYYDNDPTGEHDGSAPPIEATKSSSERRAMSYSEANLVMRYLDHVFPLQYSHISSKLRRSRGWLLWLLMKNEPLHQAVLSLAALHQYM
jgi:hypothetical protein